MSCLDRDELAARLLVALVQSGRSIGAEADAVSLADALLSRLRPSAPDAAASKPVDREDLAGVLYAARWPRLTVAGFKTESDEVRAAWCRAADAAIAFLNGGSRG